MVEKVSSVNNIPLTNNFVLSAQGEKNSVVYSNPINSSPTGQSVVAGQTVTPEPKKGNKNILWWALGGLAVAGVGGVLIYRAMKGRGTSGASGGLVLGDFAKKFVDTSIFTKTIERAQAAGSNIDVQANSDKSVIMVCDKVKGFGAQIISKFDKNAAGKVSEFDFSTYGLELKVANFDNNLTHMDFGINDTTGFVLKVDSKTGKVIEEADDSIPGLKFLWSRAQKLVDDLDPKKLLDDDVYRRDYVNSVHKVLRDTSDDYNYDKIATQTGKTIDEVKAVAQGDEFKGLCATRAWFDGVNKSFGLKESPFASQIAKTLDGDETWSLLEKMMKGELSHDVKANYTVDGLVLPKKNCYKIDFDTPDAPKEMIKISDDGEYFSYSRGGRSTDSADDFFEMELFEPQGLKEDAFGYTKLVTKDSSFAYKQNSEGVYDMEVFVDGEKIDVTDDVLASFKDEEFLDGFLKDFATKGKENILSLFK